jgi:hypothetical protein
VLSIYSYIKYAYDILVHSSVRVRGTKIMYQFILALSSRSSQN